MSIKQILDKQNKACWEVYVSKRSKQYPEFRPQKRLIVYGSRSKAERVAKGLYEEILKAIDKKENLSLTWGEVVLKWEVATRQYSNLQKDTIDDYVSCLKTWTDLCWKKPVNELAASDTRSCLKMLVENNISISFQHKFLHCIARVFKWAREEGFLKGGADSITKNIFLNRLEEKVPPILTIEEIKLLLASAANEKHTWYPVWATALWTGMRNGELFALKWQDIDFAKRTIVVSKSFNKKLQIIKETKGGYFRTVPINDSLYSLLLAQKNNSNSEFVLPRNPAWEIGHQAKVLKLYCSEIGITAVNFHALRACFATHLLSNNVSTAVVMKICGWKSLETMQRYIRLSGVVERGSTNCLNHLMPTPMNMNVLNVMNMAH